MQDLPDDILFYLLSSHIDLRTFLIQMPWINKRFNALVRTQNACEPHFVKYFPTEHHALQRQEVRDWYSALSQQYTIFRKKLSQDQKRALNFILENNVQALKKMYDSKEISLTPLFDEKLLNAAMAKKNPEMLAYLYSLLKNNYPKTHSEYIKKMPLIYWAIVLGQKKAEIESLMVKVSSLRKLFPPETVKKIFDYIAKYGRIDLLKSFHNDLETPEKRWALDSAVRHEQLGVIKHLFEIDENLKNATFDFSVYGHSLGERMPHQHHLNLPIHRLAAAHGQLSIIQYCIQENPEINLNDWPKMLYLATEHGYLHLVKYFIEQQGYDYNIIHKIEEPIDKGNKDFIQIEMAKNFPDRTNLDAAIKSQHLHVVDYLMQKDAKTAFSKPLHRAVMFSSDKIIAHLLKKNNSFRVNEIDEKGWSPLHYVSISVFHSECIKSLLSTNPKPTINPRTTEEGYTPAFLCLLRNNSSKFNELMKYSPKMQAKDRDNKHNTLLHTGMIAIFNHRKNNPDSIKDILEIMQNLVEKHKADIHAVNHQGETPFLLAVNYNIPKAVEYFLEKGYKANSAEFSAAMQHGFLLIAYQIFLSAIRNNQFDLVQHCIDQNARIINAYNDKQGHCQPLLLAAQFNNPQLFQYLLPYANVNENDLAKICGFNHPHITRLLINKIQNGESFLLRAIYQNHYPLVYGYINLGADVNLPVNGVMPLQAARHMQNPYIIDLLIQNGAVENLNPPPVPENIAPQPQALVLQL